MRALEAQIRAAQQQMRDAARRLGEMHRMDEARMRQQVQMDRGAGRRFMLRGDRVGLGVVVRTTSEESSAADGATLIAVSPGGPAEQAGLKAGDVITAINGFTLAHAAPVARRVSPGDAADDDDDEDEMDSDEESMPAVALIREVHKLKDGDTVKLVYRRGKESRKATLTAKLLETRERFAYSFSGAPEIHIDPIVIPDVPDLPDFPPMAMPGTWNQFEMVTLNPDLGSYFSTNQGILVVRAPRGDKVSLKGGDVILKIRDQVPTSPTNAIRLMRSADPGEPVQLLVLRKGAKINLTTDASTLLSTPRAPRLPRSATPAAPPAPPPAPPEQPQQNL